MGRPIKLASLIVIYSFSVAAAVNPLEQLKLGPGQVTVLTKNSDLCSDGPFKLMGSGEDQSIMVGPVISFPLSEETGSYEGCSEKISVKISSRHISRTHSISACPSQSKKFEDNVEETLSVKDKTLIYERKSSDTPVKCTFKWTPSEKK